MGNIRCNLPNPSLLIAPEGIEINIKKTVENPLEILLIAPEGIEIPKMTFSGYPATALNRTRRN